MTDNAKENLSCFCPVPHLCQMDNDSADPLRRLKGEGLPCILADSRKDKCINQAAIDCLMRQLKDPDIPYFCRVCDEDGQANVENLKDEQNVDSEAKEVIDLTKKVSTSSSQVQSSTSNNATEDPVDFCVCPILTLCTLTSDDLDILKTSTHSCCKCKKKVYGPCLGEQLDNPMLQFWCRLCDDSTLSFNGLNILQQVRDNLLQSSEHIKNDNMEVVTEDMPDLFDNPENSQNLAAMDVVNETEVLIGASKSKLKLTRSSSANEEKWGDCVLCNQAQFVQCLNKAGICPECIEVQNVSKMQSMMDNSDNSSSSSDDDGNKNKKVKSLKGNPKSQMKNSNYSPDTPAFSPSYSSQPTDASDTSDYQNGGQVQKVGAKSVLFHSSEEENKNSLGADAKNVLNKDIQRKNVSSDRNYIIDGATANALLIQHPKLLLFLQNLKANNNIEQFIDKISSDDDTNKESSSDDLNHKGSNRLPHYYSLNMFSPMDYPFNVDTTNSPQSKRKLPVFLASTVYGKELYDEMDRINKLNVSDKCADGICFNNIMDDTEFASTYSGLSPELLSNKTLTFPLRLWSGKRFESDCIIILCLYLFSNSRVACSYQPITCGTNRFGEWNQVKSLVRHRSILSTFWKFQKVEAVDCEFSVEQIKEFTKLLSSYWEAIHGKDPNSCTSLKSNNQIYFII